MSVEVVVLALLTAMTTAPNTIAIFILLITKTKKKILIVERSLRDNQLNTEKVRFRNKVLSNIFEILIFQYLLTVSKNTNIQVP